MGIQQAEDEGSGLAMCRAMDVLDNLVQQQSAGDENYFEQQRLRYKYSLGRLVTILPSQCKVLDIGSHYLHQAILLRELGHEVWGIDVELFAGANFVRERSDKFGIANVIVDKMENGEFLSGHENSFDAIIFTEILEHITFNPIRFWNRVFDLLTPTGVIYLTTPNSLRPSAYIRALWNILSFEGMGLEIDQILRSVSYGHHWKEYSVSEIRQYFRSLSGDFQVQTAFYSTDQLLMKPGIKQLMKRLLAVIPCFRPDIEAVISLSGKTGFSAQSPSLPMHRLPAR